MTAYYYKCNYPSCWLNGYAKDERGLQKLVNHKLENPEHNLSLSIIEEQRNGLIGYLKDRGMLPSG